MRSPNRNYIAEVDELRALATLLVFFYHSFHQGLAAIGHQGWPIAVAFPPAVLLYEGHIGVSLFFVLSGFILASGTFGQPIAYKRFITNRLLRILPLMVLVNVFAIYASDSVTLEGVLAPFMFLANTPIRFDDPSQVSATWLIAVEFQFYFIAPFLIAFAARKGLLGFILPAIALVLAIRLLVLYPVGGNTRELARIMYFTIVGRLTQFLIGIALALVVERSGGALRRVRAGLLLTISIFCVGLIAHAVNVGGGSPTWQTWKLVQPELEGIAWACAIAGYLFVRPLGWGPVQRPLLALGALSFSFYVLHWPMTLSFWNLYKSFGSDFLSGPYGVLLASGGILLPAVILLSALSHACVEKPFLAMRQPYVSDRVVHSQIEAPPVPKNRDSVLVLGAFVGAAAIFLWLLWAAARPWLNASLRDVCTRGQKGAIPLMGPFTRDGTFGFVVGKVLDTKELSDDNGHSTRSTAVLCEDQKPLGAPHSLHSDIRGKGGGRYSHWDGALYFSSSDNTDPNTNGRSYKLIIR